MEMLNTIYLWSSFFVFVFFFLIWKKDSGLNVFLKIILFVLAFMGGLICANSVLN